MQVPAKGSTTGLLLLLRLIWVSSSTTARGGVSLPLPLVSWLFSGLVGSSSSSKTSSSSSSVSIASCSFISFSYAARWIILLVIFTGICDDEFEWVLSGVTLLLLSSSSSASAAVFFHCAWAIACLIKRVAAALSISVRSDVKKDVNE